MAFIDESVDASDIVNGKAENIHKMLDPLNMRQDSGYMPIEHYGLIGNMHTAALVATDGGLDYLCWPDFDSPSVFCRILDQGKGGYFSISPPSNPKLNARQSYLPSSNILQTTYFNEEGVLKLTDFFPRPSKCVPPQVLTKRTQNQSLPEYQQLLRRWVIRRVEAVRGEVDVNISVVPAFNYARDRHETEIVSGKELEDGEGQQTVVFRSQSLSLALSYTVDSGDNEQNTLPTVHFKQMREAGMLGEGVHTRLHLKEGQQVTFVLRTYEETPAKNAMEHITTSLINRLQQETKDYWYHWIKQSHYYGRWQELIERSLLTLKMLTYEPTGAIVAAPTFSLPEAIAGERNWDYRFCWVRDSSFVIYIFLRMGFKEEAEAYMSFMSERFRKNRNKDGGLPIMFSIRGEIDVPEQELPHLEGYRRSSPVRIGNGAAFHKQLDIYGELMDAIYLYNKFGKPISYDEWLAVRELTDYVCGIWQEKDMSIWEVRGEVQQFVYSKVMLWVAVDRALRLAEKRCLPCPNRWLWLETRDRIMDDVMEKGYNREMCAFIQSYEHPDVLDASILIAPLVFFVAPNDPRFLQTLEQILQPPEKGGLTSAGMVHRYNTSKSDDGVGGIEGAFTMCTFWLVEVLTRAGKYEPKYLDRAVQMFENTLGFGNHVSMFSEEISKSGEQLGNTPQAFSHLAMISAAFNLDRVMKGQKGE